MEFAIKDDRNKKEEDMVNVVPSVENTKTYSDFVKNRELAIEKVKSKMRGLGWYVVYLLKLSDEEYYKDANGNVTNILIPSDKLDTDKFRTCLGEVVSIGPMAYKSMRMGEAPWVKIGDIIYLDRYNGRQFSYYGIPLLVMTDEQSMVQIDDPEAFSTF